MTWPAIHFAFMSADEQFACIRRLRSEKWNLHDIGTGWSVAMIQHALDTSAPARMRFEDWERQKKIDDQHSVTSPFSGEAVPLLPGDFQRD